jgi:hypothetical protein
MPVSMKLIAKQVLGSSAATVTFSNIPQTYTDLVFLISARSDRSGTSPASLRMTFNGTSQTSHSSRLIEANGSTVSSYNYSADAYAGTLAPAGYTTDTFSSIEIYIPNYAGSTNKSWSSPGVAETNSVTAYIDAFAGLWSSTAAITDIYFTQNSTYNYVSGSSFFLYGITKA